MLAGLALLTVCVARCAAAGAKAAAPEYDLLDLFVSGQNDTAGVSYACFRIPSMVRTKSGGLLAFAEGRRTSCGDQGDVRIVVRASADDGRTWSPIRQVVSETGHTIGNPAPIQDLKTGTLWLLYARDDNELFVASSESEGASWSAPRNVTAELKPSDQPKSWVATGPPGGVQLPSGRLVAAAYYNNADGSTRAYAVMSDDAGKTWKHGGDVGITSTPGAAVYGGGESQVVPFGASPNGLVMFIRARTTLAQNVDHNHALAFSQDGGETWTNSTRMSGIKTVYCQGSMAAASNGDLLISSPSSGNGGRINITVWAAKKAAPADFAYVTTLYAGSSAYSSMLGSKTANEYLNLFERENSKYISLARFQYPRARAEHRRDAATKR